MQADSLLTKFAMLITQIPITITDAQLPKAEFQISPRALPPSHPATETAASQTVPMQSPCGVRVPHPGGVGEIPNSEFRIPNLTTRS